MLVILVYLCLFEIVGVRERPLQATGGGRKRMKQIAPGGGLERAICLSHPLSNGTSIQLFKSLVNKCKIDDMIIK